MTAVWFAPEEEVDEVEELEELSKELEKMLEVILEVAALLLVRLEKAVLLLVTVLLEADEPVPDRKYPPTPAMTKTMMTAAAAMVVEIPVLEGRTPKTPRGEDPSSPNHARIYLTLGLESVPTSTRDVYRPFHSRVDVADVRERAVGVEGIAEHAA
jgi:hypothetical protein